MGGGALLLSIPLGFSSPPRSHARSCYSAEFYSSFSGVSVKIVVSLIIWSLMSRTTRHIISDWIKILRITSKKVQKEVCGKLCFGVYTVVLFGKNFCHIKFKPKASKTIKMLTIPESLPNGVFPVATSLLLVRLITIGIRDSALFWLFSTRFLRRFCFKLTSSLDEELFPLLLFKRVGLWTGILDFCWTGESRFLRPSISLLSRHEAIAF